MGILAVDKYGQIYETSPDRADGLGYKSHATPVQQGDVTLGSAYIKAGREQRESALKDARIREIETARDNQIAKAKRQREIAIAKSEAIKAKAYDNADYRKYMAEKAVKQQMGCEGSGGCGCSQMKTPMSGNVLTANGQCGWNGMNRDQKIIHNQLAGMGYNVAAPVDPIEASQAQLLQFAQAEITKQARAEAKKVKAEQNQSKLESDIRKGKHVRSTTTASFSPKTYLHPLMSLKAR